MVSRLTGLGTKPTTPSSFTGRPIHHSLLNFCSGGRKSELNKQRNACLVVFTVTSALYALVCGTLWRVFASNLFDMEEVPGLESDRLARHWNVVVVCRCVREVATHCKCHRLVLREEETQSRNICYESQRFASATKLLQSIFYILRYRYYPENLNILKKLLYFCSSTLKVNLTCVYAPRCFRMLQLKHSTKAFMHSHLCLCMHLCAAWMWAARAGPISHCAPRPRPISCCISASSWLLCFERPAGAVILSESNVSGRRIELLITPL